MPSRPCERKNAAAHTHGQEAREGERGGAKRRRRRSGEQSIDYSTLTNINKEVLFHIYTDGYIVVRSDGGGGVGRGGGRGGTCGEEGREDE